MGNGSTRCGLSGSLGSARETSHSLIPGHALLLPKCIPRAAATSQPWLRTGLYSYLSPLEVASRQGLTGPWGTPMGAVEEPQHEVWGSLRTQEKRQGLGKAKRAPWGPGECEG